MLRLYTLFHMNLGFSMVPAADYPDIVRRCYRPVLELARGGLPVAIEMPAATLKTVAGLDPEFVKELKALWAEGKCEFVGSGLTQAIFPLIPAEVNTWNLEAGGRVYKELLGRHPKTALVNEQTFSKGLVDLYSAAGYETIIMDWNNCFEHNRYPKEYQFFPQRVEGFNSSVNVLFSDTIAFQKFQRCVHGEVEPSEYLEYLFTRPTASGDASYVVYSNDAEVFDYRPGSDIGADGEFVRVKGLLGEISSDGRAELHTPGAVVESFRGDSRAFNTIELASPETPVVTKKQGKYNPVRWAVTGRDSAHINTECFKAYKGLKEVIRAGLAPAAELASFKEELCLLWGSDFRTHTIDEKFMDFHKKLGWLKLSTERLKERSASSVAVSVAVGDGIAKGCSNPEGCCGKSEVPHDCSCFEPRAADIRTEKNTLAVDTGPVKAEFLLHKGLAVKGVAFPGVSSEPLLGTLPHGYYDEVSLGADFFSGHLIHTSREGSKTTDLALVVPVIEESASCVKVGAKLSLAIGTLWKEYTISKSAPEVRLSLRLKVNGLPASSLRLGIFTFNPGAFLGDSLWYESTNGGTQPERYPLKGREVRHDDPVSRSVTASGCLGATDGIVRVGDAEKYLEISTDKSELYSVPMLRYTELDGSYFLRIYHTVGEIDDTAWWVWKGYNTVSFTLTAGRVENNIRKLWEYSKKT